MRAEDEADGDNPNLKKEMMIALILKSERQLSGASSFRISSSPESDPLPPAAPDSLSHHLPVHVICVRSLVSLSRLSLPVRAPKLTLYHVAAAKSRNNYCFHHSDPPCLSLTLPASSPPGSRYSDWHYTPAKSAHSGHTHSSSF